MGSTSYRGGKLNHFRSFCLQRGEELTSVLAFKFQSKSSSLVSKPKPLMALDLSYRSRPPGTKVSCPGPEGFMDNLLELKVEGPVLDQRHHVVVGIVGIEGRGQEVVRSMPAGIRQLLKQDGPVVIGHGLVVCVKILILEVSLLDVIVGEGGLVLRVVPSSVGQRKIANCVPTWGIVKVGGELEQHEAK